jgi:tRNA threonylcarbamoyladenosine biosynthesis protein TsaB
VNVLAIDTATASSAVALRLADGRVSELRDDPPAGAHPGHATRLLGMARELLEAAGTGWEALERIVVGVGPGTFTGLRVGIATARGLAQSLGVELVGVSSLQALARAALEPEAGERSEQERAVLAVIDARRGEAFAAAYAGGGEQGTPVELIAAAALAPELLAGTIERAREQPGASSGPWLAVGDGAVRYRAHLEGPGVLVPEDSSPLHRVSAAAVCSLGLSAPAGTLVGVLPDYRRRPDAELTLQTAAAAGGART